MSSRPVTSEHLRERIQRVLDEPQLPALLQTYFDPGITNHFAGITFDTLGDNPTDRICNDDLLAVSLLDVSFGPVAVRRLSGGCADQLLAKIDADTPIWELVRDSSTHRAMNELWRFLRSGEVPGVGPTRASKLLARKRPCLVPIRDSVIEDYFGLGNGPWWVQLASALDSERRDQLIALAPNPDCSPLRVLDVAVWMLRSGSRNASKARVSACLPAGRWEPIETVEGR